MRTFITCIFLLAAFGCAEKTDQSGELKNTNEPKDNQIQEPQTLHTGESIFSTQGLSFHIHGLGGSVNNDPQMPNFCKIMRNVGTLAVVKLNDSGEYKGVNSDCSGPYSRPGNQYNVQVLAVAAGNSLQTEVDIVRLGDFPLNGKPVSGDTWLVTLRESGGELFATTYIKVDLIDGNPQTDSTIDIPNNFNDLTDEAQFLLRNMQNECPESFSSRLNDETFKERAFNGCIPQDDEVEVEEEDRSEECTDINPCD